MIGYEEDVFRIYPMLFIRSEEDISGAFGLGIHSYVRCNRVIL